jgi:hypothetical protein
MAQKGFVGDFGKDTIKDFHIDDNAKADIIHARISLPNIWRRTGLYSPHRRRLDWNAANRWAWIRLENELRKSSDLEDFIDREQYNDIATRMSQLALLALIVKD